MIGKKRNSDKVQAHIVQSRRDLMIDRLFLMLIIAMLAVGTIIDTIGNQKLEKAVHDADLIAQCLDPKSECAKLTADLNKQEREYLETFTKTANVCVLYVSRDQFNEDVAAIGKAYDECVRLGTPPPPPAAPNPPPPSERNNDSN